MQFQLQLTSTQILISKHDFKFISKCLLSCNKSRLKCYDPPKKNLSGSSGFTWLII